MCIIIIDLAVEGISLRSNYSFHVYILMEIFVNEGFSVSLAFSKGNIWKVITIRTTIYSKSISWEGTHVKTFYDDVYLKIFLKGSLPGVKGKGACFMYLIVYLKKEIFFFIIINDFLEVA